jgi:hypothetical protein
VQTIATHIKAEVIACRDLAELTAGSQAVEYLNAVYQVGTSGGQLCLSVNL